MLFNEGLFPIYIYNSTLLLEIQPFNHRFPMVPLKIFHVFLAQAALLGGFTKAGLVLSCFCFFFQWGHMRIILTYIYHKHQPNLDRYIIHGSFGIMFIASLEYSQDLSLQLVRVWDTHWIHKGIQEADRKAWRCEQIVVFFWFCCGVSIENSSVWMGWTIN